MEDLHDSPESPSVSSNGHGEATIARAERDELEAAWGHSRVEWARSLQALTDTLQAVDRALTPGPEPEDYQPDILQRAQDITAAYLANKESVQRANDRIAPMLAALRLVRGSTEWSFMERDTQDAVEGAIAKATASGVSRATAPAGLGNSGTPTNTSTHTGDQPL